MKIVTKITILFKMQLISKIHKSFGLFRKCACANAIDRIFEVVHGARHARMRTRSAGLSKSADSRVTNQLIPSTSQQETFLTSKT